MKEDSLTEGGVLIQYGPKRFDTKTRSDSHEEDDDGPKVPSILEALLYSPTRTRTRAEMFPENDQMLPCSPSKGHQPLA